MIITLNNEMRPTVEILSINISNKTVDFKDIDGICNASYTSEGEIPTEDELRSGIESVFGGNL